MLYLTVYSVFLFLAEFSCRPRNVSMSRISERNAGFGGEFYVVIMRTFLSRSVDTGLILTPTGVKSIKW